MSVQRLGFASLRSGLNVYFQLTTPRIVALLLFTMFTAMIVAANGAAVPLGKVCAALLGGAFAAGGASTINQVIDRDLDRRMSRTSQRPIASGRLAPLDALLFGLGLIVWSMLIFGVFVNWLCAALSLIGALYYVIVYTLLLKRRTVHNVIIGGGAGAIPVLVGWAAITDTISPQACLLSVIIFLWTPPHRWALSFAARKDYECADIPMLPVRQSSASACAQILWYSLLLALAGLILFPLHIMGGIYFLSALALNAGLLFQAFRLSSDPSVPRAGNFYKYSSLYLVLLFLAMIADRLVIH